MILEETQDGDNTNTNGQRSIKYLKIKVSTSLFHLDLYSVDNKGASTHCLKIISIQSLRSQQCYFDTACTGCKISKNNPLNFILNVVTEFYHRIYHIYDAEMLFIIQIREIDSLYFMLLLQLFK